MCFTPPMNAVHVKWFTKSNAHGMSKLMINFKTIKITIYSLTSLQNTLYSKSTLIGYTVAAAVQQYECMYPTFADE